MNLKMCVSINSAHLLKDHWTKVSIKHSRLMFLPRRSEHNALEVTESLKSHLPKAFLYAYP